MVTHAELDYAPLGEVIARTGSPADWPMAINDVFVEHGNVFARDRWNWPSEGGDTVYEFKAMMPFGTGYQGDPLHALGDFVLWFQAGYETALLSLDWQGEIVFTRSDFVVLTPGSPDDPLPVGAIPVRRQFATKDRVSIDTNFYWPPAPTGVVAGYTAPLEQWIGTTISGLTSQPIQLHGYFSQTYRPGHHNFTEEFLFEPQLEPGLPDALRAELEAKNIRMIYFSTSGGPLDAIKAIGFDQTVRDL
jgi:hypothetical protein